MPRFAISSRIARSASSQWSWVRRNLHQLRAKRCSRTMLLSTLKRSSQTLWIVSHTLLSPPIRNRFRRQLTWVRTLCQRQMVASISLTSTCINSMPTLRHEPLTQASMVTTKRPIRRWRMMWSLRSNLKKVRTIPSVNRFRITTPPQQPKLKQFKNQWPLPVPQTSTNLHPPLKSRQSTW